MAKKNNNDLKKDIRKVLSEELGNNSVTDCGRKAFSIDDSPEIREHLVNELFGVLEKYMVSKNGENEHHMVFYRQYRERVDNFVKLGDILEVESIEPFEQGEVIFKLRYDLMRRYKK